MSQLLLDAPHTSPPAGAAVLTVPFCGFLACGEIGSLKKSGASENEMWALRTSCFNLLVLSLGCRA